MGPREKPAWQLFFAGNCLFLIYLIWFRLNPLQVDVGGHIASANTFARGFFHSFNDQMFLGYIPNLFYPPLEDLIITLISAPLRHPFFGIDSYNATIWGFQLYLSLLFSLTLFSAYRIGYLLFETAAARALFYLCFISVFCADKTYAIANQGIGAIDTLCIGLSSQLLSFLPFSWLIREIHTKRRPDRIALLILALVLSHLVTGIGASILVGIYFLMSKRKKSLLGPLLLAVAASAAFTLPFITYQEFLVNRVILLRDALDMPIVVALLTLVLQIALPNRRERVPLVTTILITTLAMPIATLLNGKDIDVPRIHYYRFVNIGLICFIFLIPQILHSPIIHKLKSPWKLATLILVVLGFAFGFKPYRNLPLWFFSPKPIKVEETAGYSYPDDGFGRSFVISNQRPIDFGIESLLSLTHPNYRGTKGLYWESARGNYLANSYFANLIDFAVILDATVYMGTPCDVIQSLFDQFFRDYSVTSLIYDSKFGWEKRTPWTSSCWKQIVRANGTQNFKFIATGKVSADSDQYQAFRVVARNASAKAHQQLIEIADPRNFREIPADQKYAPFVLMMNDRFKASQEGAFSENHFLDASEYRRFAQFWKATSAPKIPKVSIQKLDDGKYLATLPLDQPVWVSIKLASLPGWTWKDSTGKEWPVLSGFPSLIAAGQGEMVLEWKRPTVFWVGYLISTCAVLIYVFLWIRSRKAIRRTTSAVN